jgi:predicted nucleic acid-binding protein
LSEAFVDTSSLLAIAFAEPGARGLAERLAGFDRLLASNLLEAEFRTAVARERVLVDPGLYLASLTWILPDRPLTQEYERILAVGLLRGADLWHLACALFVARNPGDLSFITLDRRQRDVAGRLGFA